jgi:uncharacterized protein (DUF1800 family)
MNRAGFGLSTHEIQQANTLSQRVLWQGLSAKKPFVPFVLSEDSTFIDDYQKLSQLTADAKKELVKKRRAYLVQLNSQFLFEMVKSEDQLREKMAFFWHGHFATRINNPMANLQLINSIREHALGNFKDLLLAVSKSPAMLQFLNNQQNKKGHPNENFAREVMELFTMGRGNYTESDVKEAARAFTGWGYKDGEFVERKNAHDFSKKTFLNQQGNFNGDEVLQIILDKKATAAFIVKKIYRFFVNEQPDVAIIEVLSQRFRNSDYDIKDLMHAIFTSNWFFENKNIGTKIKSPIELMVGMLRLLPMPMENYSSMLVTFQKLLGQMLFFPPNVSGWPSGTSWIDSSTLMLRLQMPQIWSGLRPLEVHPLEDDDMTMGIKNLKNLQKSFKMENLLIDWEKVENVFSGKNLAECLLQITSSMDLQLIKNYSNSSLKSQIINLMSTPEYQLC